MNIIGLASLISALLVIDHFVKYPIDVKAVKAILGRFWQYLLNEDGESLFAYGMMSLGAVVVVVLIIEGLY